MNRFTPHFFCVEQAQNIFFGNTFEFHTKSLLFGFLVDSPSPPPIPPKNLHENTRQDSLSLSQGEERRKSSKRGEGGTKYENDG